MYVSDRIKAVTLNSLIWIPLWVLNIRSYFAKINNTEIVVTILVLLIIALLSNIVQKRFPKYKITRNEKNRKIILYIDIIFVIVLIPTCLFYRNFGWLFVVSIISIIQNYLNYTGNN